MQDNNNQSTHAKSRKNNVTNIKSTDNPQDKKKVNYRGIHKQIVDAMIGNNGRLPEFPQKLHRWVDRQGNSVIHAEDDNRVVRAVANAHVNYLISGYWEWVSKHTDNFWGPCSADDVNKIRNLWLASCPPTTGNWNPLAWKSDPGLALHRMSFDPIREITYENFQQWCPAFYDFMMRVTNHKTLMAWIGSLFDKDSQRQQYVWIHGPGGDGKSAFLRALMRAMGDVASAEQPPTQNDKHWTYGLRHKRLVVFADMMNATFVTTGLFKTITGEDKIRMDGKNRDVFTDSIDAKVILSSNKKPSIPGEKADLRRILFFGTSVFTTDFGPSYEEMLNEEMEFFLSICWDMYMEYTGGYQYMDRNPRKMFKCEDETEIDEIVSETEHDYEMFATEYIRVIDSTSEENYVTAKRMQELMKHAGYNKYEQMGLRKYLKRKYNITTAQKWFTTKSGGHNKRVFFGCIEAFEDKD